MERNLTYEQIIKLSSKLDELSDDDYYSVMIHTENYHINGRGLAPFITWLQGTFLIATAALAKRR